jgi:hypothetical protein
MPSAGIIFLAGYAILFQCFVQDRIAFFIRFIVVSIFRGMFLDAQNDIKGVLKRARRILMILANDSE